MPDSSEPPFDEAPRAPELVRLNEEDLADASAALRRLAVDAQAQRQLKRLSRMTRLASGGGAQDRPAAQSSAAPPDRAKPQSGTPILRLSGQDYAAELERLTRWVDEYLLRIYGREVNTARPWCAQWPEHPEAVARLHALWLAWQQHITPEAGLAGVSVWHRDHLDHALAQLRSPDGPFAACTTSPNRPSHRLLPAPTSTADQPETHTA